MHLTLYQTLIGGQQNKMNSLKAYFKVSWVKCSFGLNRVKKEKECFLKRQKQRFLEVPQGSVKGILQNYVLDGNPQQHIYSPPVANDI